LARFKQLEEWGTRGHFESFCNTGFSVLLPTIRLRASVPKPHFEEDMQMPKVFNIRSFVYSMTFQGIVS
jgi:hypothetical protein